MPELIKTITIGDRQFNINRMGARVGSVVLSRLLAKMQSMAASSDEQPTTEDLKREPEPAQAISVIVLNMDEKDIEFVQDKALSCVEVVKDVGGAPVPIAVLSRGSILPELDIDDVMTLTQEVLVANFARFFTRRALEKLFGVQQKDSSQ